MVKCSSPGPVKVKRALVSVSDKTCLEGLVKVLSDLDVEIISTGRTHKIITSWGVNSRRISEFTGAPEMMNGRVKTLHPKVHGAILADRNDPEHMGQLKDLGADPIDMVVVNLYPFEEVCSRKGSERDEIVENIDIGGPTLLRSAAKNCDHVAVVSDIGQYEEVMGELKDSGGSISLDLRRRLAADVFEKTARYDSAISDYLRGKGPEVREELPDSVDITLKKIRELRYGENPHQKAAFYQREDSFVRGVAAAKQLNGKELSFNNIADIAAAVEIVKPFKRPAVSIVKHANPCGVASGEEIREAFLNALDCDRMSAFGGIMAFNREMDAELAELVLKESGFIECVAAPGVTPEALGLFKSKKNLRVLELGQEAFALSRQHEVKFIPGAALIQESDAEELDGDALRNMTAKAFPEEFIDQALFGWRVVKSVKSNAIVLVCGEKTVGIGAGQMSRVDAVELAIRKAGERARGALMVSDAFFPKADSVELAHKAGVAAIVQPGGSIRDPEVIETCDKYGIPMAATGMRCFKH